MICTKDDRKDLRSPLPAMLFCIFIMLGVGIWHDFYSPRPSDACTIGGTAHVTAGDVGAIAGLAETASR